MADQQLLVKLLRNSEDGLTEDDLDDVGQALSDTGVHYELDRGRLILMSPMKNWHVDVSARIRNLLIAQGRIAYQEQGVRLGIPEYWIADRHPGARRDAVIEFFRLGPSGTYERTGEAVLSELEQKHGTR